jgi:hypothetical protein
MTTTESTPSTRTEAGTSDSVRAAGVGRPAYSETLPCEVGSARKARILTSVALVAWGLGDLCDDGMLIVSELATNSIRHARSHYFRIKVARIAGGRVRFTVTDRDRRQLPPVADVAPDVENRRGLAVVQEVSARYGVDYKSWGKSVWSELALREAPDLPPIAS